jgi:hypothetical protein
LRSWVVSLAFLCFSFLLILNVDGGVIATPSALLIRNSNPSSMISRHISKFTVISKPSRWMVVSFRGGDVSALCLNTVITIDAPIHEHKRNKSASGRCYLKLYCTLQWESGYVSRYNDGLRAVRPWFDSRQRKMFIFSTKFRPALRPRGRWVPGTFSPRVKQQLREADHPPPSNAEVENGGAIRPLPQVSSWL